MKEMTTGIEDIQKALDGSEMLELSSDKQSVRRITEMRKKDDIDEYMIYVVRVKSECFIAHVIILIEIQLNLHPNLFNNRKHYLQQPLMKRFDSNSNNSATLHMFHYQNIARVDASKSLALLNSKKKAVWPSV